ncbi:hypothetical protein [uncultured Lactococcus sp.]|uniref:hypothetical protein n=1 Tax=uncultured Lactococcus sp. TaxID=167973 RepID=UPI0027DBCE93|nr:hypothetical protein [uncultured Lactococcus sp.]
MTLYVGIDVAKNKHDLACIDSDGEILTDIYFKQKNQLEDLSSSWKGAHARSVLSETANNHQIFQRTQQKEVYESKRELLRKIKQLQQEQDKIIQEKRLVAKGAISRGYRK